MYAVFWEIKKFEHELWGWKFKLITDHKSLEEIINKPNFDKNRINRWIEKIQEFDFKIEYSKGKLLVVPDALSRVHEEGDRKLEELKVLKKVRILSKEEQACNRKG